MNKLITGLAFSLCMAIPCSGFADYLLESATLGPTGAPGDLAGYIADRFQFVGARFHISQPSHVDHIGGVLGNFFFNDNQQIFGAIVPIIPVSAGGNDFPVSSPGTFTPLAETTFMLPFRTADLSIPLSVTLPAGDYSLIFGSNRFGATGTGTLPITNTDTAQASYFFGNKNSLADPGSWSNDAIAHNMRFTVSGTTIVPEPGNMSLAALGFIGFTAWCWRRRKSLS